MIAAQGGDPDAPLPTPAETHVVTAPATGTLTRLDAFALGVAAWRLGAGRARKEDPVSAAAGVVWRAGVGEQVTAGQPLLELQTDDAARIPRALEALEGAIGVDTDDQPLPLILDRITACDPRSCARTARGSSRCVPCLVTIPGGDAAHSGDREELAP